MSVRVFVCLFVWGLFSSDRLVLFVCGCLRFSRGLSFARRFSVVMRRQAHTRTHTHPHTHQSAHVGTLVAHTHAQMFARTGLSFCLCLPQDRRWLEKSFRRILRAVVRPLPGGTQADLTAPKWERA